MKTVLIGIGLAGFMLGANRPAAAAEGGAGFLPLNCLVVPAGSNAAAQDRTSLDLLHAVGSGRQMMIGNHAIACRYDMRPYDAFLERYRREIQMGLDFFPGNLTGPLSSAWYRYIFPHDSIGSEEWALRVRMANGMAEEARRRGLLLFYQIDIRFIHQKKLTPEETMPVKVEFQQRLDGTRDEQGYVCFSHPRVRKRVRTVMEAICSSINLDGIYFEEPCGGAVCYCSYCRAQFHKYLLEKYGSEAKIREYFGKALAEISPVPPSERLNARKVWYDWFRFVQKYRIDYLAFIADCAQQAALKTWHKKLPAGGTIAYDGIADPRALRVTELMSRPQFTVLWHAYYWQCFGDHYDQISLEDIDFRSYHQGVSWRRSQALGKPVWQWEIARDEPGWVFEIEAYSSLLGGISGIIPFVPRKEAESGLRRAFRFARKNNDLLMNVTPVSPVALYYSHEQWNYQYYDRADYHGKLYGGAWEALINRHIPAEFVSGDAPKDLDKYKVLVISGAVNMSKEEAKAITQWVKQGGALIAFAPASANNLFEEAQDKPVLAEVMGITGPFEKIRETGLVIKNSSPALGAAKPGDLWANNPLVIITGRQNKIKEEIMEAYTFVPNEQAAVLAVWEKSRKPALLTHAFGRGKCALIGGHLAALDQEKREMLMADLVKWGLAGNLPLEFENLPAACDVNVLRQANRLMVHVLNLEPVTDKVRKASPLKNVKVSVESPPDLRIKKAYAVSPDFEGRQAVPVSIAGHKIQFAIPELAFYVVVVLE